MTRTLAEDTHFRVLRVLDVAPDISQREIARELGLSLGAVNYCLQALVKKGQIKVQNFGAADKKLRYAYVLTPAGIAKKAQLTGSFLKRKVAEFEALKGEIEAVKQEIAMNGEESEVLAQ